MKFRILISLLFSIFEISFYLVKGQTAIEEGNDCTKLLNYEFQDTKNHTISDCCSEDRISCENGYITFLNINFRNVNFSNFPIFTKLREIRIINNELKYIPEVLFKSPSLEMIILDKNDIETIPSSISNATNLKQLYLGKNKIKTLPDELFKLSNLETLDLQGNEFKIVPSTISGLTKLKYLWLNQNDLVYLSDQLINLPNLEYLNLSETKLEKIPSGISGLTKLNYLSLGNNKMKDLPEELFKLPNLEILYVLIKKNKSLYFINFFFIFI